MHFEQFPREGGVAIKVTTHVEKPKIAITNWPKFTVNWMGSTMEGRVLAAGVYQLGSVVVLRNDDGDYVELAPSVYMQSLERRDE